MSDPSSTATNEPKSNADAPRGRASKSDVDYLTFRHIPPIGYTPQNSIISIDAMISSFAALCFTLSFVLPVSILRRSVRGIRVKAFHLTCWARGRPANGANNGPAHMTKAIGRTIARWKALFKYLMDFSY